MNDDDIADQMIAAWNDPFATESDPRLLLIKGAKEIRHLRTVIASKQMVIGVLHQLNEEMAQELKSRRPDPNSPLYLAGLFLIGVVVMVAWMLVSR